MITKGQKINDRYEIVKSIGEGGMANVYLAVDTILDNRKVAIKILRGDLANDEKFIRRFKREALSASSLSHPNIVAMYDVGEDEENYFIVMEYIEGRTLKQLLKRRGNLTISEAVDIMLQITDGIAHAHDSYIVHRDLKPQNIMIQENGAIKITDFGIAMALNSTQLTQTNSVMGSVHYLPPEQASGKGATIKSDIYSMGILFFELLTGILPFKGDNAVEIALKHMKDPIPSIRKINSNIPQSIENIVLKATAKNPKNRYSDVKEMHHDLEIALNPDVQDQAKYIYPYPEHDAMELEDTEKKSVSNSKDDLKEKKKDSQEVARKIEDDEPKKVNAVIWILSIVLILFAGGLAFYVFLFPMFNKVPTIKVPDVSGYTVAEADNILTDAGFNVEVETEKVSSDEYAKGKVVKTEPIAGRSRKKGTSITIYESIGSTTYIIEDYVGENYIEVQTTLEKVYKLKVVIEKKDVSSTEDLDEQAILEQSLKAGTKVTEGETIILYVPNVYLEYPDFVSEGWNLEDIQAFCDKYDVVLKTEYIADSNYPDGTVTYQSRTGKIVPGVTIKIKVVKNEDLENPGGNGENNNGTEEDNASTGE